MNNMPAPTGGLTEIIQRAAADPDFDIDKLQRLLDVREQEEARQAERIFNAALVDVTFVAGLVAALGGTAPPLPNAVNGLP